jgi:hypothetical protein
MDAPVPDPEAVGEEHVPSSWEFIDQPPTSEIVRAKLETLEPVFGLAQSKFVEFVQPLSQSKNLSLNRDVKDFHVVWTLYFTVAGRIEMVNQAAILNDWRVDFEPEPSTPTGIPGMLQYDGNRIVYREYCVITDAKGRIIGRKPGTAWVPAEGGSGAVSSNRFEKVETSARGRSLAAWGFGVLPGSGVASFDEMLAVNDLRNADKQASSRRGQQGQPAGREQKPRGEVESEIRVVLAEYQQTAGITDEAMSEKVLGYTQRSFNKTLAINEHGAWIFDALKEGELVLMLSSMKTGLNKLKSEQATL